MPLSELQPSSNLETSGSRTEAYLFTDNTEIGLHVGSDLPSADAGREAARLAREQIEAELGPRPISPQVELATLGSHLADFRAWMSELADGDDEQTRTFREVRADFEHRATQVERQQGLQFPQRSSTIDMMGYEAINSGR